MQDIPSDVCLNILKWLPSKSLLRFRCVSKTWQSIIDSDYFQTLHRQCNTRWVTKGKHPGCRVVTLYLQLYNEAFVLVESRPFLIHEKEENSPWGRWGYRIVGSCHGLLCIYVTRPEENYYYGGTIYGGYIYISNPSIRQCKFANQYNRIRVKDVDIIGFGFDSRSNDYKVVLNTKPNRPLKFETELYSLREDTWKTLEPPPGQELYAGSSNEGTYFSEACHWIWKSSSFKKCILCFKFSEESFSYLRLPEDSYNSDDRTRLMLYVNEEMLSVCALTVGECTVSWHVWAMKEYGVYESWTCLMRVDMETQQSMPPSLLRIDGEVGFVLSSSGRYRFVRDQRTEQNQKFMLPADGEVVSYEESLIPVENHKEAAYDQTFDASELYGFGRT